MSRMMCGVTIYSCKYSIEQLFWIVFRNSLYRVVRPWS